MRTLRELASGIALGFGALALFATAVVAARRSLRAPRHDLGVADCD